MFRSIDACNHWRQLASCRIDGELTEFELTGLERHCAVCADCSLWMRELDYIADAIQMSERAQPGELVCARLVRRRARRLPPLVAASASIGAAFLAAIAIVLPGRGGLVGEQALTGTARNVSIADPPPRSLVLSSIERAQGLSSHSVTALHRPELP